LENPLNEKRREEVWYALSEAFIDDEVDYAWIADKIGEIDKDRLRQIFFEEVAPYCGPNLMTAIPPIWAGFDREKLVAVIHEMISKNDKSVIAKLRHKTFVIYLRLYFGSVWHAIESKLVDSNLQNS
jgi:hypothetical protein